MPDSQNEDDHNSAFELSEWRKHLNNNNNRPFEKVSFKLSSRCGAIQIASFLANDYDDIDLDYHDFKYADGEIELRSTSTISKETASSSAVISSKTEQREEGVGRLAVGQPGGPDDDDSLPPKLPLSAPHPSLVSSLGTKTTFHTREDALDTLYKTCIRLSGSPQALHFELIPTDTEPQRFSCLLTIYSLNGTKRTYKTTSEWGKRYDAKGEAARLAIAMGAIDFIRTGDSNAQNHKHAELIARAQVESKNLEAKKLFDPAIQQIESCCVEWRLGSVKPYWASYRSPENKQVWGGALCVSLRPSQFSTWSTEARFSSPEEARVQCAKLALGQGVLDYIKFGNGQKHPPSQVEDDEDHRPRSNRVHQIPTRLSLEEYVDTLPKPWPADFGNKPVSEISASGWLNSLVQKSKINKFKVVYYYSTNYLTTNVGALVGCVLRLEGPGTKVKTYIVENHFSRHQDAKNAACFWAMSQNVEEYIRRIIADYYNHQVPRHLQILAEGKIIPTLSSRSAKIRPGNKAQYEFVSVDGRYGCTLTIDISKDADRPDLRKYSIEPLCRTKLDAKHSVACTAAQAGAIELLRFGTMDPPKGQRTFWDIINDTTLTDSEKHKLITMGVDQDQGDKNKRKREGNGPREGSTSEEVGEIEKTVSPEVVSTNKKSKKRKRTGTDGAASGAIVYPPVHYPNLPLRPPRPPLLFQHRGPPIAHAPYPPASFNIPPGPPAASSTSAPPVFTLPPASTLIGTPHAPFHASWANPYPAPVIPGLPASSQPKYLSYDPSFEGRPAPLPYDD